MLMTNFLEFKPREKLTPAYLTRMGEKQLLASPGVDIFTCFDI